LFSPKSIVFAKERCHKNPVSLGERYRRRQLGRQVEGIAACLLPFDEKGEMCREGFQAGVARNTEAGLGSAVNMDTGYANYISEEQRGKVLNWTREAVGEKGSFVGGVFVEGKEGELLDLYRDLYREGADEVVSRGGIPILFQTTRFHDWPADRIVELYRQVCEGYDQVLGFELGKMFAPNGMIYSEEVIEGLMEIPSLMGIKHSSLSREVELKRLKLRDEKRPDFKIYTGNDLGIDMIEYGSDYLLGLAAFCPEKFAERDRLWSEGDEAYDALNDALQYLGNVAFRPNVAAYKHSCAVFQNLLGRISTPEPHSQCPRRPEWEGEMMKDCAQRLGYELS